MYGTLEPKTRNAIIKIIFFAICSIVSFILASNELQVRTEDMAISFSSMTFVKAVDESVLDSDGKISAAITNDCHCTCVGAFATLMAVKSPQPQLTLINPSYNALCSSACSKADIALQRFLYTGRTFALMDNYTMMTTYSSLVWDMASVDREVRYADTQCRAAGGGQCWFTSGFSPSYRFDNTSELLQFVLRNNICTPKNCYCTRDMRDTTRILNYLSRVGGYFALFSMSGTIISKTVGLGLTLIIDRKKGEPKNTDFNSQKL